MVLCVYADTLLKDCIQLGMW